MAALQSGKPNEQTDLLVWITAQCAAVDVDAVCTIWPKRTVAYFLKIPPFKGIVNGIFVCLEDRNPQVRKAAQDVLPVCILCSSLYRSLIKYVIANVGLEKMKQAVGKLSASSKSAIMPLLEKAKVLKEPTAGAMVALHALVV
jgi:hypothetical protein